ncbi:two component transcriptional regulator, LuxR family [Bradyrhizobium lablabi]|uniref:Two component transcriptional regulator, LuxR family n=2 Tax=Bradyrhizobium lablabi TaxID=722472 RepID=A0A1M6JBD5_9BRAD|nr:two component transcriptional regulator, LuxR family [Bradyrhizobium lablabi]
MSRRRSFATVLVGKHILLREGLARILRPANFRILASVLSADNLLQSKLQLHQPLFLIVHTGDDFDAAVEQIELFRDQHPGGRIAIVADHYRLDDLVSAFRAGANGYFVDVMTCDAFIKSLELVMMGETIFPPAFLSFVLDLESDHFAAAMTRDENNQAILVTDGDTPAPQLSPREKSILGCLIEGDSNKCIARKIDIAEATVKVHVKAILRKIRVQNRTQAAIWGMNNGWLARTANNKSPLSTSDVNKRLPNPVGEIPEIKRIDPPVPLGVIDHETIQLQVPRTDHFIGKLKTEGRIRLRK